MVMLPRSDGPRLSCDEALSDRTQPMITVNDQGIPLQSNHDETHKAVLEPGTARMSTCAESAGSAHRLYISRIRNSEYIQSSKTRLSIGRSRETSESAQTTLTQTSTCFLDFSPCAAPALASCTNQAK